MAEEDGAKLAAFQAALAAVQAAAAASKAEAGPAEAGPAEAPLAAPAPENNNAAAGLGTGGREREPRAQVQEEVALAAQPELSSDFAAALERVSAPDRKRRRPEPQARRTAETVAAPVIGPQVGPPTASEQQQEVAPQPAPQRPGKFLRTAAGKVWEDQTLAQWPENDFRLWVGQLGPEVTQQTLHAVFCKYPSYNMCRVTLDKRSGECRGYGFVSFSDPMEMVRAMREQQGKYCGNRPMKIKRSQKEKRDLKWVRRQEKKAAKIAKRLDQF